MSESAERVTITASLEEVPDTLADFGGIREWNPGVIHSKQTHILQGELGYDE